MRRTYILFFVLIALVFIPVVFSQGPQDETSRAVAGGGVTVSGWTGKVDAREASQGMTLNSAKFAKEGDALPRLLASLEPSLRKALYKTLKNAPPSGSVEY